MSTSVNGVASPGVNAPTPSMVRLGERASGPTATDGHAKLGKPESSEAAKLHSAATQFEAVFVRQLLKAAKFGEEMGSSGYGGMALEALADGVTRQGGLGLAKAIEDTLRKSELTAQPPNRKPLPGPFR
jgi:Rod binding domain-containing protein